jgi:hypothetical protein
MDIIIIVLEAKIHTAGNIIPSIGDIKAWSCANRTETHVVFESLSTEREGKNNLVIFFVFVDKIADLTLDKRFRQQTHTEWLTQHRVLHAVW